MDTMDSEQSVESLSDEQVLVAFGMAADSAGWGFDAATQARVFAFELVRARHRVAHYRALYATFLDAGQPYMVENLDDAGDGTGLPAKLVFTDDVEQVAQLEANGEVEIWTELELLRVLTQERTVQEFFTDLLDELLPRSNGTT